MDGSETVKNVNVFRSTLCNTFAFNHETDVHNNSLVCVCPLGHEARSQAVLDARQRLQGVLGVWYEVQHPRSKTPLPNLRQNILQLLLLAHDPWHQSPARPAGQSSRVQGVFRNIQGVPKLQTYRWTEFSGRFVRGRNFVIRSTFFHESDGKGWSGWGGGG